MNGDHASKRFLGDGVYVEWDGAHLVLTTENGLETTNTIYLEPEVFAALKSYVRNLDRQHAAGDVERDTKEPL